MLIRFLSLHRHQTFDEYSHFVTKFDNDNYDQSLPAASKLYSGAAKRSDEREIEEAKLVSVFLSRRCKMKTLD